MALFFRRKSKAKPRAVIVGLDGVPYTLLKDMKNRGRIPNMAAIFEKGYFGQMSVCIPEISAVSWSSFMTGTQSGEHGIFGFTDLKPGTYNMHFLNFNNLKASTLWDELGDGLQKTVVINMPATYPAREINGALISGFVAVDINKAVYPSSLIPSLKQMGYRIDLDTKKARQDHDFLFRDLDVTLEGRRKAVDFLWKEIAWDLFIVVITGTDRLMHFLWDAFEEERHPYHQAFIDYFDKVDGFVGRIYDRFIGLEGSKDGKNQFVMLSDHGFAKIKTEVYLNRWLQENGYLKFQKEKPETIMDIGPGSTAFALDPSRIYIHQKGRYPRGEVETSDVHKMAHDIRNGLTEMEMDGEQVLRAIFTKEEIYEGPLLCQAPDLICLSNHGFDLKGSIQKKKVFNKTDLTGMHTQDDAFFYSNQGKTCSNIFNVKSMILDTLS